jgi:fluoride exporter
LLVLLGVGCAGGVGAAARFLLDGAIAERVGRDFPYGTYVVNVSGSLLLGVLAGGALHGDPYRLAGVGAVGGYTTFSTWVLESQRLAEDGQRRLALLNFAISLASGVVAAALGRWLAR